MHPLRGEVWYADLSPTRGHEQAGVRPVLIVSVNRFNRGRGEMVVVLPLTRTERNHPLHIRILPPEGGLTAVSFALCDNVRAISIERLDRRLGTVSSGTLAQLAGPLRYILHL